MAAFAIALAIFLLWGEGSASIQDHCSDISYWDEIRYETTTKQCCHTKLQQVCTTKSDQVCQDVLELQCEVVAWGECRSTPTSTRSTKCGVKYNDFAHQNCEEVTTSVSHTKKVPECKEITKNNCVTDWDVDSNGNKIWAGTETCTPVTWEECQIVEKTVEFPTVKTECDVDSHIKWTEFVDITTNIVGLESKCEVKKAVNCKHVLVNKCAPVVWQECKMEPREECLAVVIHTPTQEKIHQQKCLTGDNTDHLNQIRPQNQIHSVPSDPASVLRIEAVAKKDIRAIGELKETIETIEDDLEKNANGLGKRVSIGNVGRVSIRNERFEDYLAGYELVLFNTMNDALFYLKINCGTNAICDGDQIEIFAREIKDAFKKIEATGNVSRWLRQHFSFLKNQIYDAIVEAEGLLKHKLDDFLGSLPRAGGWSDWTEVGECSATCGPATKLIWRSCTNPAPVNGGSECSGSSTGVVSCALSDCAIDGGWTEYSDWSFCSKTCGEGDRVRSRTCTNPPPSNGGKDCLGQSFEVQTCLEAENCPIDGGWNEFSDWSVCSQTCGVGQKVRSRTCTNPPPSFGGEDCLGQSEEVQSCVEVENCPIDGGWTEFYDLSSCSKTCGLGQKVSSRTCTNPPPSFGGEDCLGQSWKVESCVDVECSIDGGWTEFSDWSACSKSCGGEVGQKVRSRTCTNPPPSFGGDDCLGQSEEVQSCVEVENCPIDGGWSEFSDWGACSNACGEGQKVRSRTCTNPPPSFGGDDCLGQSEEVQSCVEVENCPVWELGLNINPCDGGNFGYGGPWSKGVNVGTSDQAFTKDFIDINILKKPAGFITIARHVNGQCTMSKTWELKDKSRSMYSYFATYPGRIYATGDGSKSDNHIASDIPPSAEGLTGTWRDPIFGAEGGLVFNWYYANNGVRVGLAGGYKKPYTLPAANLNDDDFHGLGNEFGADTKNGHGSSMYWHDVAKIGPTCGGRCPTVGTDHGGDMDNGPCWGSYAIFVSQDAKFFNCQGRALSTTTNWNQIPSVPPTCRQPATTLSTSPGQDMVLCKDDTRSTCQKDFESLCPAGWNLCTPGQFNNRNDGWDYNWREANDLGYPLGVIYCTNKWGGDTAAGNGAAAHYQVQNILMNKDQPINCVQYSLRPGCELGAEKGHDCSAKYMSALCCAPTSTCGDGEVQQEEDCDDGNDSNMDDCLNTCTWKTPNEHGGTWLINCN